MPGYTREQYLANKERLAKAAARAPAATLEEIRDAKRPELYTRGLQVVRKLMTKTNRLTQKLDWMQQMAAQWKTWIEGYERLNGARIGFAAFRADWKYVRLWIDLQERLLVEQVLYDKGGYYRELVSGFRPIGGKD